MPDRRWCDADRELVAEALGNVRLFRLTNATWSTPEIAAERVLDALTAAGKLRENAVADILAEVDGLRGYADDYLAGMRRAAEIAMGGTDA